MWDKEAFIEELIAEIEQRCEHLSPADYVEVMGTVANQLDANAQAMYRNVANTEW